jgi:chromosome segregation ATPase
MDPTVLISVALILIALAATAWLVLGRLAVLPGQISTPVASAVERLAAPIAGAASNMTDAVTRMDAASKTMSGASSALTKTTDALSESHQELSAVVTTVNGDGSFGEWVATLQRTVQPIVTTSSALTEHFDTTRSLVRTTGELVTQWAEQRRATEASIRQLSETLVAWAASDSAHAGRIEERILQRLQEVSAVDARIADGLSRLQTAHVKLEESQARMSETLRDTLDANRSLVKSVEQLLHEYRSAQQRFAALQTELQERVIAFQRQSETMLGDTRKSANALVAAVERSVKTIIDGLQSAHKANEASIRELAARQAELADAQRHYVKQQEAALGRFADELALLPTRRYQLVSIGILGLNTVLVAIAVFYVLSRNA